MWFQSSAGIPVLSSCGISAQGSAGKLWYIFSFSGNAFRAYVQLCDLPGPSSQFSVTSAPHGPAFCTSLSHSGQTMRNGNTLTANVICVMGWNSLQYPSSRITGGRLSFIPLFEFQQKKILDEALPANVPQHPFPLQTICKENVPFSPEGSTSGTDNKMPLHPGGTWSSFPNLVGIACFAADELKLFTSQGPLGYPNAAQLAPWVERLSILPHIISVVIHSSHFNKFAIDAILIRFCHFLRLLWSRLYLHYLTYWYADTNSSTRCHQWHKYL